MTERGVQGYDVSSAHKLGRGYLERHMCGGRSLLASGVAIDKTARERGVVMVGMQVMLTVLILRQLSSYPESPA